MVKIPFKAYFKEAMLSGRKTATSRFKKYGWPGDTFQAFGATFEIMGVAQVPVYEVAYNDYQREGCDSPDAFWQIWREIHPVRVERPDELVYFHVFRRLPDAH